MSAPLTPAFLTFAGWEVIVQRLESLSYRERRNEISRRMPGQYPRFFYKFRGASPEDPNLRSFLLQSRLWLSDLAHFNDPFDMKAHVVVKGARRQIEARFKRVLRENYENYGVTTRRERRQILKTMMAHPPIQQEAKIRDVFCKSAERAGICSFGGDPRSILMWAHYGQNHEGLCFQFEFARDPRTFSRAQRVEYSDKYPVVNYAADESDYGDQLNRMFLRKHSGWSYEKEWRIFHLIGANTLLPFRPDAVVGVIIGCRASDRLQSALREVLIKRGKAGLPPVRLYRTEQHQRAYELVIKRAA